MTGLEVCIVILLAVLVCAFVASLFRRPEQDPALPPPARPEEPAEWYDRAIHRRIVVHVAGDDNTESFSIEGTLHLAAEDGVLLWGAKMTGPKPVDLSGEVFVPRARVLFVQTVRM